MRGDNSAAINGKERSWLRDIRSGPKDQRFANWDSWWKKTIQELLSESASCISCQFEIRAKGPVDQLCVLLLHKISHDAHPKQLGIVSNTPHSLCRYYILILLHYFIISLSRRGSKTICDDPFHLKYLNSFEMFDMIWYGLDMFGPVWLCLNTFSILFGVPSCGQGYYMGHLSRSGALVLRGIGLTAGIALKKWRKKGEIETQTRWDMQILIDLTVSQCLASIPSTNVPTKKQVHREKIRTYWILLNLKNSVTQHLLTSA